MNENNDLILTMDFGTQSVRVSIFNDVGEALAMEKVTYEPAYYSPKPGWAEQDPDYYFDCLCKTTKKLSVEHPELISHIKGITLTCFRDSAVLLDKDRKVLRPMVLWLDQRFAKCEKKLPWYHRALFRIVGKMPVIVANRKRTISNWIIENEPETWAKVDKYVAVSTYWTYRLTGLLKEPAAANVGHYPLNYKKRKWYRNVATHMQAQCFSLTNSMLSEISPEGSLIGGLTEEASKLTGLPVGLPLYSCGSDKSCETLGDGIIDSSMAAISLGTACTIDTTTVKYQPAVTFFPAYPSVQPGHFNMERQVYRGYWMINWFLKEFGAKNIGDIVVDEFHAEDYNEELEKIPAGSDGLMLQPYWGPALERPQVKGMMIGFTDNTTKAHFYKAIIEGISYALYEGMEDFKKKLHHGFDMIRISGGGSNADIICQITADVMGVPVSRVQTNETSSLGAAISGFMSIGRFASAKEAVDSMVHQKDVFLPREENHKTYMHLYKNVYKKLYPHLKKEHVVLCEMTKR